jgi:hypothetical protein
MKTPEELKQAVKQITYYINTARAFIQAHPCPDATEETTVLYEHWKRLVFPDYYLACIEEYLTAQQAQEPKPAPLSVLPGTTLAQDLVAKAIRDRSQAIEAFLKKVMDQNPYINLLDYTLCSQNVVENGVTYTTYWLAKRA